MTEHPGEQFPPDVDPDVEPGFDPHQSEETTAHPDYDTEPGAQDSAQDVAEESVQDVAEHVDPAAVEFGPEFARPPGEEYEHSFEAGSAEDPGEEQVSGAEAIEEPGEGGHPLVEETMARLDELRDRPVSEHGEVYADLHERLQSALVEADAEQGDRS
ncbi:hypothetical protein OHA18_03265 [Kribbella sp. NBC_00709]|uniref:hypothetical protein n=1 Tax=Kribbella sp. NBC_00709 TaxID=2975972 RepID=UPI002E28B2EB|nr:hypothetical protein [Kribbella sp. NBC_00709]